MTETYVDAGQKVGRRQTRYTATIDVDKPELIECPLNWLAIGHGPEEGGNVSIAVQGEETITLQPGRRITFATVSNMDERWYSVEHLALPKESS